MSDQISKHDHVLMSLTLNLQAMAMVQLGKVSNPATGEVERDLDAARGTIDILEMLKVKCRAETHEEVLRMLDQIVMDLQLNYMDELKQGEPEPIIVPRLALHAERLSFTHPISGLELEFASDLPEDLAAVVAALGEETVASGE